MSVIERIFHMSHVEIFASLGLLFAIYAIGRLCYHFIFYFKEDKLNVPLVGGVLMLVWYLCMICSLPVSVPLSLLERADRNRLSKIIDKDNFDLGEKVGYDHGYDAGQKDGYHTGYAQGYRDGFDDASSLYQKAVDENDTLESNCIGPSGCSTVDF